MPKSAEQPFARSFLRVNSFSTKGSDNKALAVKGPENQLSCLATGFRMESMTEICEAHIGLQSQTLGTLSEVHGSRENPCEHTQGCSRPKIPPAEVPSWQLGKIAQSCNLNDK